MSAARVADPQRLIDRGWSLVPIPRGSKGCFLDGWPRFGAEQPTEADLEEWAHRWRGHGWGIPLGAGLLVVDVDTDDPAEQELVERFRREVLPATPLLREGRPGRVAALYRLAQPYTGDRKVAGGKIELLTGSGTQVVAFALHPDTGKPYRWLLDDPHDLGPDELPEVALPQLAAFALKVEQALGRPVPADGHGGGDLAEILRDPLTGLVVDGRESFLTRLVWATSREHGDDPERVFRMAWEHFTAEADLTRQHNGRGRGRDWWRRQARQKVKAACNKLGREAVAEQQRARGNTPMDSLAPEFGPAAELRTEGAADTRPVIRVKVGAINDAVRAGAKVLKGELYLRGMLPHFVIRADQAAEPGDDGMIELHGVRYAPAGLLFHPANPTALAGTLDDRARFEVWRKTPAPGHWATADCPEEVANRLAAAAYRYGVPQAAGICRVPLFLGGRIYDQAGFHPGTGLVLDLPDRLPPIPEAPTKDQADAALKRLLRPFRGYLKSKTADIVAVAAAALTAVLRPSLPTAPAILIDANQPRAGKGKKARALAALTDGGVPAIVTEGHNDEETEKRIAAAVLAGGPCLIIDNLTRRLASSTLESALTEPVATIRRFSKLENLTVAFRALTLITANNGRLRRDMLGRVLPVRLVVREEHPELRRFDFDPVAEVRRDRAELLAAAFTVERAWWRVRDQPDNLAHHQTLGSFELWAEMVAAPVAWLLGRNPVDLIVAQQDDDPVERAAAALFVRLHQAFDGRPFRAAEAYAKLSAHAGVDGPDLELIQTVAAPKGAEQAVNVFGAWLQRQQDMPRAGLLLSVESDPKQANRYRLTRL